MRQREAAQAARGLAQSRRLLWRRQAEQNLTTYFNLDTPQSQALLARIQALGTQPVAVVVPDLDPALAALQTYLRRHDSINAQPVPETPAAPVQEEPAP